MKELTPKAAELIDNIVSTQEAIYACYDVMRMMSEGKSPPPPNGMMPRAAINWIVADLMHGKLDEGHVILDPFAGNGIHTGVLNSIDTRRVVAWDIGQNERHNPPEADELGIQVIECNSVHKMADRHGFQGVDDYAGLIFAMPPPDSNDPAQVLNTALQKGIFSWIMVVCHDTEHCADQEFWQLFSEECTNGKCHHLGCAEPTPLIGTIMNASVLVPPPGKKLRKKGEDECPAGEEPCEVKKDDDNERKNEQTALETQSSATFPWVVIVTFLAAVFLSGIFPMFFNGRPIFV